ncbi:MAG: VOC family protein [Rubrobacter sp.]
MARLSNITFACKDPARLADLRAIALDYEKQDAPPEFMEAWLAAGGDPNGAAALADPFGTGTRIFFEKKYSAATTPARIHLDITAEDRPAEVARLVEAGAQEIETKSRVTGPYIETGRSCKTRKETDFVFSDVG